MAKRAKKRTAAKPVRRRRSRVEREQRMRRYIVWTTIVVGVAVVGLVAYGLVSQQIRTAIQMRQPVAVVNGTEIPMKTLRDRARFYEGLQQSSLSPSLLDYVLDEVIRKNWSVRRRSGVASRSRPPSCRIGSRGCLTITVLLPRPCRPRPPLQRWLRTRTPLQRQR